MAAVARIHVGRTSANVVLDTAATDAKQSVCCHVIVGHVRTMAFVGTRMLDSNAIVLSDGQVQRAPKTLIRASVDRVNMAENASETALATRVHVQQIGVASTAL